jgi:DNA (cytosine-5)-methyltransferase 1
LADLGYAVGWRVLNSKNFGVPQSRQRVYIVGCYRDKEGPGKILFEAERREGHDQARRGNGAKSLSPFKRVLGDVGGEGPVFQAIAYCLYACSARHTGTDWSRTYVSYPKKGEVRRLMPAECEGIMGFPRDWTVPPPEAKYSPDDLDSMRYHALGNAVTPPVIAWIAGRIKNYLLAPNGRANHAAMQAKATV